MADILHVAEKLARTNVTKTLVKILNKKATQKFITDLNTKVQLFDYGEDSQGVQLSAIGGLYAESTIRLSRPKKKNRSHINLKDTGDFYKTFDVTVKANSNFTITANTMKQGQNLEDRWGDNIVGLQDENVIKVMDYLRDEFYREVFKGL
jgi:hypothetical protein